MVNKLVYRVINLINLIEGPTVVKYACPYARTLARYSEHIISDPKRIIFAEWFHSKW